MNKLGDQKKKLRSKFLYKHGGIFRANLILYY